MSSVVQDVTTTIFEKSVACSHRTTYMGFVPICCQTCPRYQMPGLGFSLCYTNRAWINMEPSSGHPKAHALDMCFSKAYLIPEHNLIRKHLSTIIASVTELRTRKQPKCLCGWYSPWLISLVLSQHLGFLV